MKTQTSIDKAGRVVLPKPVRDELQIEPGDPLEIESTEEQVILRPVRGTTPLRKKKGIWVFRAGEPLSASAANRILRGVREERDRKNLGKAR
jgi:AbrB family looped-hinge helix DNA binding protein